jgi:hypothetical protein
MDLGYELVLETLFSTPPIIMDFILTAYFKVRSQFSTAIPGVPI